MRSSATLELGGEAVLALRLSEGGPTDRVTAGSPTTATRCSRSGAARYHLPWPKGCPIEHRSTEGATEIDVAGWRDDCAGLTLAHMGRGPDDDPWFFASAYAAGALARALVERGASRRTVGTVP